MEYAAYCGSCGWEESALNGKNALDKANTHLLTCSEYRKASSLGRGDEDVSHKGGKREWEEGRNDDFEDA